MIEAAAIRDVISPVGLGIMCVVIAASIGAWVAVVFLAARRPYAKNRNLPRMQSPVLGGMHEAEGGRSVAPTRDAPVNVTPRVPGRRQPEQAEPKQAAPERPTVAVGEGPGPRKVVKGRAG
ncbi:MAG TPA: hypothetical protein VF482_20705 [Trebonia sp.]